MFCVPPVDWPTYGDSPIFWMPLIVAWACVGLGFLFLVIKKVYVMVIYILYVTFLSCPVQWHMPPVFSACHSFPLFCHSQIADAMAYMEKENFIHRNLGARNILVGVQNRVKVAGFGMTRTKDDPDFNFRRGEC